MKERSFTILLVCVFAILVTLIYFIGVDEGYNNGYEDAVSRMDEINEQQSQSDEWINVPVSPDMDTTVYLQSKYLKLKIIGTGDDKAKIHAYFPSSDSTWSHYIIE